MKKNLEISLDDYVNALSKQYEMDLCLYDIKDFTASDELRLAKRSRVHNCPYCMAVKRSPKALAECIREEHEILKGIPENQTYRIQKCRAGIVQLIVPLRMNRKLIGGIFAGMCFQKKKRPSKEFLLRFARRCGLSAGEICGSAAMTRDITIKKLRESSILLFLLRDYILYSIHNEELRKKLNRSLPSLPDMGACDPSQIPPPQIQRDDISVEIGKSLEFIGKNYWRGITREAVAEFTGLSVSHFSRRFKRETGSSFRSYLQECLISAAAYMIKHSTLSVENIARRLGFSSSAAFNRSFRTRTGFSPRRFMFSNAEYPWVGK